MSNPMTHAVDATAERISPGFGFDDRRGTDRRRRPTPALSRYAIFGGRRVGGRRTGEDANQFVDRHGPWLFLVVVGVVALNFLDAWFTVLFLSHGGVELNPLVDQVIQSGLAPFILLKSAGIGFCVAVLTLTKNFRVARLGLGFVFGGYALLLGWHLYLFWNLQELTAF
jgi:hypothetical protein